MEKMELIAPCHFGMEAVLKREVLDLGYEISTVEDGRVWLLGRCTGDLRCERVPSDSRKNPS